MSIDIRPCDAHDLEALNDVYNHYVQTSPATFDIDEVSMAARREWFSQYGLTGRYRVFVAYDGGDFAGYASSSRLFERRAYETSVMSTVYIAEAMHKRGVGTRLYSALFAALEGQDVHRAYAGITQPNDASNALHEKFNFRKVAHFTEQGRKFERYWDVAWYEKEL